MFNLSFINSKSTNVRGIVGNLPAVTYSIGDVITSGVLPITFENVFEMQGGSGILYNSTLITNETQDVDFMLQLFTTSFAIVDGSPINYTIGGASIVPNAVATLRFTTRAAYSYNTSGFIYLADFVSPLSVNAAANSTNLFGVLIALNAYTSTANTNFHINIQTLTQPK
jgi:hypothetical protein